MSQPQEPAILKPEPDRLLLGEWEVRRNEGILSSEGRSIRLEPRVMDVLVHLAANPGKVVSKEELLEVVWCGAFVEEGALPQAIHSLRKALGDDARQPRYVQTVPKRGYRLVAPVEPAPEPEPARAARPPEPSGAPPAPVLHPRPAVSASTRRWALLLIAIVGLATALGLVLGRGRAREAHSAPVVLSEAASRIGLPSPPSDPRKSVAVLGFRNLSEKATNRWLGPALTEMLTAELAAGGKIRVVSSERTAHALQALRREEKEAGDLAHMENVHALVGANLAVTGSYLPIGNQGRQRIRLDIQILNLPAGETVASMVEEGEEGELFDIVARAGSRLRSTLGFSRPTLEQRLQVRKLLPAGSEAIRLYAESLSRLRSFDLVGARDLLLRAGTLEPRSVVIQSALSEVWIMLGQDNRAREAALRAFNGRHSLPQEMQLVVEARFYETGKQWDRASDVYRSLRTLFPEELEYSLKLSDTLSMAGRGPEALAVLDESHERPAPEGSDPRIDIAETVVAARISDLTRMEKAAENAIDKGRRLGSWLIMARGLLTQAYFMGLKGQPQKAIEILRQAEKSALRAGDRWTVGRVEASLGEMLLQQGDLEGAEQVHQQALVTARELGTAVGISWQLYYLGQLYRERGDLEQARMLLEESLSLLHRIDYRTWEARVTVSLASIHLAEGDLKKTQRLLTETLAVNRSVRGPEGEVQALQMLAELRSREGRLDEALQLQEKALRILLKVHYPGLATGVLALSADLLARTGNVSLAHRRLLLAEAAGRRASDRLVSNRLLGTGARFAFRKGDLAASRSASEEQRRLAHQARTRPLEATALRSLARIAFAVGEIPRARDLLREAWSLAEKSRDRLAEMEISVEFARLDLEEGLLDTALKLAREAADWYHVRHFAVDESAALALAAESLLRLGRLGEAREVAGRARMLVPETDHDLRLEIAPALARVEAMGDPDSALRTLGSSIMEAEQIGFVPEIFEARLALGEILLRTRGVVAGREELGHLKRDAEAKGFRQTSRRAAALLAGTAFGATGGH